MDRRSTAFRLTAWLAGGSFLAAGFAGVAPQARAQDSSTQVDAPQIAAADPPGRVGRLARLQGSVSTHGAGATQWTPAVLNFPFVSGDALWTEPQAQADIQVGASLATLADRTELDLATLDDHNFVATEPQGAIFLDVRDVQPGDTYTVNTPRGAVQIAIPGEYEILAGDTGIPTRVVVVRGAAQLTSGALALRAEQGQMAVATGDRDVQGDVEAVNSYDPFLTAMLARNSAPSAEPQVVQRMTGAEGLAQYGSWQQNPDYGQVWYPQVAPDWVPYRDGSWSYVAPWGWTWVDNEPWGFAPFHYGRWAEVGERWCWVPGQEYAEPVYAPALVDFLVAGAVAGVGAGLIAESLRSGRGDVGWVPLGPREAYEPPYGGSQRYRRRMNWGDGWHRPEWDDRRGRGDARIANNGRNPFINRRALTIAPAAALARSQQIRPVAHGMGSPAAGSFQTAAVQPLHGPLPIRPVAETRGLTPLAARRLGLANAPVHPPAAGPAINPAIMPRPGSPGGRIPFRGAAAPAQVHDARVPAGGLPLQHGPGVRPPLPPQAAPRPQAPRPGLARPEAPPPEVPHPEAPPLGAPRPGGIVERGAAPHFAAPRPAAPGPIEPRVVVPGPAGARIEPPRPPAFRAGAPRPTMDRPMAPRPPMAPPPMIQRPMVERPMMQRPMAPAMQPQRPMQQPQLRPAPPQFSAPRPMSAPAPAPHAAPLPPGRPPHP